MPANLPAPGDRPPNAAPPPSGSTLDSLPNPMNHPEELPSGTDGTPHFGRLLLVLAAAVMIIVAVTFGSQSWFS